MIERIYERRQAAAVGEKLRAPTHAPDAAWRLEPHVCRVCFGRVASQAAGDARRYQCTNCGIEELGSKASVLCACGLRIRRHRVDGRSSDSMADAGIRCHENKRKSPEFPALFVASYGGVQPET